MSFGEGASQNRTAPENKPIETCHQLLNARDFEGARFLAHMNQLVSPKRHEEFEKVRAICDVLIAAKRQFPMDYYGMIRVTPPGPVLLEDFKKLMKLLDGRHNRFPCSQEAAQEALVAWSLLSKPDVKADYDLALSKGGGFVGKGKGKMESEYSKRFQGINVNPFQSGLPNSLIPKQHNVGSGTLYDVVVAISNDDDDVEVVKSDDNDDDDDSQWNLTGLHNSLIPEKHNVGSETLYDVVVAISNDDGMAMLEQQMKDAFVGKGKGKMESEFSKRFQAMNVNPVQSGLPNSLDPKKHNVGSGTLYDVVVAVSNDDAMKMLEQQRKDGSVGKCKGKMEPAYSKRFQAMNVNPFQSGLPNSLIPKENNVGSGTLYDVVVAISNDDDITTLEQQNFAKLMERE